MTATKTATRPAPVIVTAPGYARVVRGRVHIDATFASSRPGVAPHPITVDDSGRVLNHECPATVPCWHVRSADAVVLAWHRLVWEPRPLAQLLRRQQDIAHFIAVMGDRIETEDHDACLLELEALAALVRQRTESEAA